MRPPDRRTGPLVRLLEVAVLLGAVLQRRGAPRLPHGVGADDLSAGYEHSDMSAVVVGIAAIALLVTLGLALIGVTLFQQAVVGVPFTISRPSDLTEGIQAAPAPTPPAPRLEAQSGQTLNPYRDIEQQKLNSYGWVDRSSGLVRIPIDRAMDLTAQRGLPARAAPQPAPQDDGATSPSVASSGRVSEPYP